MSFSPQETLVSAACYLASVPFRLFDRLQEFDPPERLLILKPCCIGDVLMATPVVTALKRAFPGVRIDWAVGSWSREMVASHPRLGKIISTGTSGGNGFSWPRIRQLARRIEVEHYDTCLILDRSPVMSMIPWLARIPQRVGLDSAGRGFANQIRVPVKGIRHEAEVYLDVVRALGVGTQGVRTEFHPTEQDRAEALAFLSEKLGWDGHEPLFVFHPAGGRNPGMKMMSKRWPPERYALLANRLVQSYGGKGLLLGGPQDSILLEAVRGLTSFDAVALPGGLNWGVWAAILEKATLCVGNDTGATHLAVAVGCKTVFVFGPSDPRRYGPYARPGQAAALWHPIVGMVNGVDKGPPRDWSWDDGVTTDEAWNAARGLLDQVAEAPEEEE